MDNQIPKISVIMPFYNAGDFLDKAIVSILNQSFTDFEFIIINDASTDNSDEIVNKYLSDKRIVYIKNENNVGVVKNLNKGLALAKADIIARMDGDDISDESRFLKQYQFLQQHSDISGVGTFIKIIDQEGKQTDQRTKPVDFNFIKNNTLAYLPLVHATGMFRRLDLQQIGNYREEYKYCEDLDLIYRLVFSGFKISNIPEFLYQYRYHANSSAHNSKEITKKVFKLRQEIIKKFNLKIGFKQKSLIYFQYIIGMILSGRQKQYIEGLYKLAFYHEK